MFGLEALPALIRFGSFGVLGFELGIPRPLTRGLGFRGSAKVKISQRVPSTYTVECRAGFRCYRNYDYGLGKYSPYIGT